tara:strand:+ start:126 stop:500 length:375 start_codon:yes stop_codon:yes gene_type:complete
MNIKDTIKDLGLENEKLPRILSQRVATAQELVERLEKAEEELENEPTEENEKTFLEVKSYTEEYFNDAKKQLESYKAKLEKKEELDAKPTDGDDEKKSSGMGALLIGGVLLVATLGAVNIMRKK